MTDLEEDWQDLSLRKPVVPTGELLDDLVEDWDVLQGRNSWFVALYDAQLKRLPGSTVRVTEAGLREAIMFKEVPVGGTVHHVGYWSRFQRIQFARMSKPTEVKPGQSLSATLTFSYVPYTTLVYSITDGNYSGSTSTNTNTFTIPTGSNSGTNNTDFFITFTT